jgi:small subunit ribosomal protein S5e
MAESATPVKLFGKWSLEDVEVSDLALVVSLGTSKFDRGFVELQHLASSLYQDFLAIKGKHATFVAHTAGRYQRKCFKKANVSLLCLFILRALN